MEAPNEERLRETLRKIEALYAAAGTARREACCRSRG